MNTNENEIIKEIFNALKKNEDVNLKFFSILEDKCVDMWLVEEDLCDLNASMQKLNALIFEDIN